MDKSSVIKKILVIILFLLLSINIAKNLYEITMVSSMDNHVYVPILMYHQVKGTNLGKDVISPYEFECDLKFLKDNNYNTITMSQLVDYVYNDVDLPENPIILSFDDGYLNTYKNVYPLLKKYNMKIVLSIVGKSTDDFSRVVDTNINYAHMTWDQIKEVQESGLVEIQNHSYNMHKVRNGRYGCSQMLNESFTDYEQFLMEDVNQLQDRIYTNTESTPNTFTYPYGKYNDNTNLILKELGFKATLSCRFGVNVIDKDPESLFELKRICRSHNRSVGKLIKEAMETLKYSKD
ncbi:MAG TPA: polysaccharide deacetylase family protein [Mobilitalea sp.]|nr:polysaccharide deacetylase family protein [Mobilitalea sp.]